MHFRVKNILKNNHYRTFKNFFILLGAFNQYKNYILILFWEVIEKSKTRLIKIERNTER
jgi:chromatin segregation and condensation protein Rec8/ScpA/Scc1 (kleisin family)